jgi:hypothetical protein
LETMGRTIARVNGLKEKEIMGQRRFSSFRSWKRLRRAPRGWRAALPRAARAPAPTRVRAIGAGNMALRNRANEKFMRDLSGGVFA